MSITVGGTIKMTLKSRLLLFLDRFFRSLYPKRLNCWIFDHLDYVCMSALKCPKCGSTDHRQVTPEELEREDPEGYAEFGFYSFIECRKCGYRWLDD